MFKSLGASEVRESRSILDGSTRMVSDHVWWRLKKVHTGSGLIRYRK
jgi:hypothetical protein